MFCGGCGMRMRAAYVAIPGQTGGFSRLKHIEYLLKSGQVDERVLWTGA